MLSTAFYQRLEKIKPEPGEVSVWSPKLNAALNARLAELTTSNCHTAVLVNNQETVIGQLCLESIGRQQEMRRSG